MTSIERYDEIFIGRLIAVREVTQDGGNEMGIWGALFEIDKKWKGSNSGYVEVFQEGTSCDFPFDKMGKQYLVYAAHANLVYDFDGRDTESTYTGLGTYLCSRTMSVEQYEYKMDDWGWDDRPRLDRAFPKPVFTIPLRVDWRIIGLWIILPILGLIIGLRIKSN